MRDKGVTIEHAGFNTIEIRNAEADQDIRLTYEQAWDLIDQLQDFLGDRHPQDAA